MPAADPLAISAPRARWLPRHRLLLLAPSPYLELHLTPGGLPDVTSAPCARTTAPELGFFAQATTSAAGAPVCGPVPLALVLRDAAATREHARLGTVRVAADAAHVEGWFRVEESCAELYLVLHRPAYCARRWRDCPCAPPEMTLTRRGRAEKLLRSAHGELRSVAAEVGALFRQGQMTVAVEALDVPVAARELAVVVQVADQTLWGGEMRGDAQPDPEGGADAEGRKDASVRNAVRAGSASILDTIAGRADTIIGRVAAAKKNARAGHPGKLQTLVEAAGAYAAEKGPERREEWGFHARRGREGEEEEKPPNSGDNPVQSISTDENEGQSGYLEHLTGHLTLSQTERDPGVSQSHRYRVGEANSAQNRDDNDSDDNEDDAVEVHDSPSTDGMKPSAETQTSEDPTHGLKRHVDFGSFRFAVMQGAVPRMMHIKLVDNAAPLPAPLGLFQEHNVRIPELDSFTCTCKQQCKTHVFRFRLNGLEYGRVTLLLRVEYKHWKPVATSKDVTNNFLEIFSRTDKLPHVIHTRFPQASQYRYLFIGGLFTQHYPTYFEKNIRYLKEKLGFATVEEVPIHTEGSIERNARDIHQAIMKSNPQPKSVVLIGHSKGGVDAVEVVKRFPDVVPFLYGILSFQAPFGGTYLVDFVSRSRIAAHTIAGAIEKLARGDEAAFADMGYTSRFRSMELYRKQSDIETETYPDPERDLGEAVTTPGCPQFETGLDESKSDLREKCLDYLKAVPIVAFASRASFDILKIRSAATAAGIATMAPAAQVMTQYTGFSCDGLVTAHDARIPYADNVLLDDMMHTEPALYVKGTNYPPGQLTASGLLLLFERAARET